MSTGDDFLAELGLIAHIPDVERTDAAGQRSEMVTLVVDIQPMAVHLVIQPKTGPTSRYVLTQTQWNTMITAGTVS